MKRLFIKKRSVLLFVIKCYLAPRNICAQPYKLGGD